MRLYEKAKHVWLHAREKQILKGKEKYGVELEDANLSASELTKHAVEENVDQLHYIVALGMKAAALEKELKKYKKGPTLQAPVPFKVGDVIWRKNGTFIVGDKLTATVSRVEVGEGARLWLNNNTFYVYAENVELYPLQPGDKVWKKDGSSFSTGGKIVTVSRIGEKGEVWLSESNSFLYKEQLHTLEKAPTPTPVMRPSSKSINQLCAEAFGNAKAKGWHDEKRSFGDVIALIHSELSEALEDYRNGNEHGTWYEFEDGKKRNTNLSGGGKPCGIPSELADVCIRIFDYCGSQGINLESMIYEKMAYNSTRPARHGGKKL